MARTWTNWMANVRNRPRTWLEPVTDEELVEGVRRALSAKERIRVVGGGHTWSEIADGGDQALVCLDGLTGVTHVDRERQRVTVRAGTRLYELNDALHQVGLGLSNLGSINKQSAAGVVATATHGTGIRFGTLSSAVTDLTLLDGQGQLLRCSREEDPDLFHAARCNLGALGVLTEITFQCEPAFRLEGVEEVWPLQDALDALEELVEENDHFKLWWIPHTESVVVFKQNRTEGPERYHRLGGFVRAEILKNAFAGAGMTASSFVPRGIRLFNKLLIRGSPRRVATVRRSDRIFNFPVRIKHWEMEYAVPRERARDAFDALRSVIERLDLDIGFIVELRFVKGGDAWLSPAYQRDSAYLGALQHWRYPHEPYFHAFEEEMTALEGRPHWGKLHYKAAPELAALYPRWDDFQEVRRRVDSEGAFLHGHVRRLLGEG